MITIKTKPNNLDFSAKVVINNSNWRIDFLGNSVRLSSRDFSFRSEFFDDDLNPIVGHIRNVVYLAFEIGMYWGYKALVENSGLEVFEDGLLPESSHSETQIQLSNETIDASKKIFSDIVACDEQAIKSMLGYWRRARELEDLGFNSEAFLNYFKVIECLSEIEDNHEAREFIKGHYCIGEEPNSKYKRKYDVDTDHNMMKSISFVSKALASANLSHERFDGTLADATLDALYIRHRWNVGHKIVGPRTDDKYDSVGQHSDNFDLTSTEIENMSEITKMLILSHVRPGKYLANNDNGVWLVKQVDH